MSTQNKVIGHIGLGYWGKNILRNLHELGFLHTACDSDIETVNEFKKKFPARYTTSIDDVLKDPEIKAVSISTPAATHYDLVKKALSAGKDVFVEKPLSLTVKQGEDLVAMAEREKCILMVGHILQYHPAVIKLKELVSNGDLGKIQYIYSNRLNIGKLRTEENILWSFAPHDISVILMLLDEEPSSVSTVGGDYLTRGIYDTTMTTLGFKNGVKGHIFVSWLHPYKEQKLIVVGSKAMAVFDDVSKEKLVMYPHRIEWHAGKVPVAQKAEHMAIEIGKEEPLREELKHFVECVTGGKRPKTDGAEGLRVLKVLEACEKGFLKDKSATPEAPKPNFFAHESACVDDGAKIGDGTRIWHFSHILKGSVLGKNCVIGQNVAVGPDVAVGDGCKIQNNVSLYKGVVLEEGVFCGPSCVFTNVYNPRAFIERKNEYMPTLVKKGVFVKSSG